MSLSIEARLDDLVAQMTVEEKASQLQARSCPPIDRLGIPFFCWGQNAITGLDDAIFPIAPAMAATFNITNNVAAMAEAADAAGHSAVLPALLLFGTDGGSLEQCAAGDFRCRALSQIAVGGKGWVDG